MYSERNIEMTKKSKDDGAIYVTEVKEGSLNVVLVGKEPLIINRMSEKAKHELLLPRGRKTAAEKAHSLKHDPIAEFRASAYTLPDDSAPTLLAMPAAAPKKCMAGAALDMPGAKKAQIGRLTWIPGEMVGVYGLPKLFMSITRSAGMDKVPDVRTRCIVPNWAMLVRVNFVTPILNPTIILNLLNAAGMYIGLGDWRPEKGAGSYGQFRVLSQDMAARDREAQDIMKQGRKQQKAALSSPEAYNTETEELLTWFESETKVRGIAIGATA